MVGALVTDGVRIYAHRRTMDRKLFPGCWDVVYGHVEEGETLHQALIRELDEETGWEMGEILGCVKDFEWQADGVPRHERDYLITVIGMPIIHVSKRASRTDSDGSTRKTWLR